ncbi:MAG: hypothetical protein VKI39_02840 [Synechococcus sp.]|nr:hypothetical protein [Synechococcus sp.]
MRPLLLLVLSATAIFMGLGASACEKHLNGHQNSSDTNLEGSRK